MLLGLIALVELLLQFMHELVEVLHGQGIDRRRSEPARLFKSPFELYSLLLFHVGMTGEVPLRFSSSWGWRYFCRLLVSALCASVVTLRAPCHTSTSCPSTSRLALAMAATSSAQTKGSKLLIWPSWSTM